MADDDDFEDEGPETRPEPQTDEEVLAQLDESLQELRRLDKNRATLNKSQPEPPPPPPQWSSWGVAPDLGEAPMANATFMPPPIAPIRRRGDTEDLLNGLIAECHHLMREVALPSALRCDEIQRQRYLASAMQLATTGAEVAKAIAKLRSSGQVIESRQRHYVERIERVLPPPTPHSEKA